MKKLLSTLSSTLQRGLRGGLLFLALVVSTSFIYASDTQVAGIWYDFNSSTKTASVTYQGSTYNSYTGEYSGSVVIPSTVRYNGTTYSVRSIGDYAFFDCSSLTSITIPNSVTSIGDWAFEGCSSLTSVTINSNAIVNKDYSSKFNISHIFGSQVTKYIIGESVTSIGDYAFYNCSSLTSITIPNSVTSIGDCAFNKCSSLTSVTIPNSITSIGDLAFVGCSSLTKTNYTGDIASWCDIKFGSYDANPMSCSHNFYINDQEIKDLVIPNTVGSIHDYAFAGCSSLTSITIPNSVTSIGDCAFNKCGSLTSVIIPNSVTSIGYNAFFNCSSLTKTNYTGDVASWCGIKFNNPDANPISYSHNFYINDQEIKDLVIPNTVGSIHDYAFYNCSSLTSVTIPNSVTSIGNLAFYNTAIYNDESNWENDVLYISNCLIDAKHSISGAYTIKENTRLIAAYAFAGCRSLTSVTIPNSVTSIGDYAFRNCSSLTSVTIPNSVTSIGKDAFEGCSSLTSVTINSNAIVNKDYSSKSNISHIFGSQVTKYIIGESVTSIGDYAFTYCSRLKSITIGNSVKSIGDKAFYMCISLTSMVVESSNTTYDSRDNCNAIIETATNTLIAGCKNTTIPNSVTSIGQRAFCDYSTLTSVTIPNSVRSIGERAFYNCINLTSITCEAATPPRVGSDAFHNVSISIPVYVPCRCINAYKAVTGWENFTNIQGPLAEYSIEVNVNDTIMGTAKVDYNNDCTGNQISATANYGCHFVQWSDGNTDNPRSLELTQDTILTAEFAPFFSGQCGDNLYWAYDQANKTISITGSGDMYNYTAETQPWLLFKEELTEIHISNKATSIGTAAFQGCTRLSKINIGTAMKNIAANAFANCNKLYDIYCYAAEPPTGYTSSFANYNAFLHVPCESQRLYMLDILFGEFKYIECISSDEVTTDDIVITPGTTDVTITWPTEDNAYQYVIEIKKDSEVFCTLTFNSEGLLLNIAFAPGRKGTHSAQYAAETANGLRFTVTGLEEGTNYTYDVITKDKENNQLSAYSGEFTTYSNIPSDLENLDTQSPKTDCQKLLRDGQLLILKDNKVYTIMGQETQ